MKQTHYYLVKLAFLPLIISGCGLNGGILTTVGPDYKSPTPETANHWQAKQPVPIDLPTAHHGNVTHLTQWWERFGDPALTRLLAAAQKGSASIANAKAKIEEARADLIGSESVFLPNLDSSLSSSRASFSFGNAPFIRNQHQLSVQSSWEIDLFGGLSRQREASLSQLQSRTAAWHDARVAVSAELANAYLAYRYCQVQSELAKSTAESRQSTATLVAIAAHAGFRNLADVSLANAIAAEGRSDLLQRHAQCDRLIKGLVALTGVAEPQIRIILNPTPNAVVTLPKPPFFQVHSVPIDVIRQRPDVAVAERNMAEASAKIGVEQANRFPKLSLSGNITPVFQNINGAALTLAETWSFGPTLSLPLFDAGKRLAKVDSAKEQYEASVVQYRATVRNAVKEVEEAMVRLATVDQRLPHAQSAVNDYQTSFLSAQKLFDVGLGNLIDVESNRRNWITAQSLTQELEQEKASAWIALYRSVGGSWEDQSQQLRTVTNQLPAKNPNSYSQQPKHSSGDKS